MDRQALIELSDLNLAEAYRELTRRSGGTVLDDDGVLFFAATHPLPVFVNGMVRTDARCAPEEALARARTFFAERRRGFTIFLLATDADLAAAGAAAGLTEIRDSPGMVLEHRLQEAIPPAGVRLQRVEAPEDVAAFTFVNAEAYATYGMPPEVATAILDRREVLVAPHVVSFVAYVENDPAAAAMVIMAHGVAGVYWVGTLPAYRGRGLAELCTRAATNAGFDLGARIAALQASPMGEPIYRRMGYVEVTRYRHLVQFPTSASR